MSEHLDVFHKLERITEGLDQAVKAIRSSQTNTTLKVENWIITWFLIPFHSLVNLKGLLKGTTSINITPAIPVLAGTILSPFASFLVDTPWYILIVFGIVIGYIISFVLAPRIMCDFTSDYFRIGAYAKFRKQEYEIFKQSLVQGEEEFYFSSIPKQLQGLIKTDENLLNIYNRIDTFLVQEKVELASKVQALEDKYSEKEKELKQAIKEYDTEASDLLKANTEVHKAVGYLVDFLKATRLALLRKTNKKLNISDLTTLIGAGVSIYVIRDGYLELKGEEQTAGYLPDRIYFDDETTFASIFLDAALSEQGESFDEPEPDYFIISRRFPMNIGEEWVISFHVDAGNEKALFLTVGNDILEVREVYKVIHSLCLLQQELESK